MLLPASSGKRNRGKPKKTRKTPACQVNHEAGGVTPKKEHSATHAQPNQKMELELRPRHSLTAPQNSRALVWRVGAAGLAASRHPPKRSEFLKGKKSPNLSLALPLPPRRVAAKTQNGFPNRAAAAIETKAPDAARANRSSPKCFESKIMAASTPPPTPYITARPLLLLHPSSALCSASPPCSGA